MRVIVRRIAVLDDYQDIARSVADWSSLGNEWEVDFFHLAIVGPASLASALKPYEVVVLMRERTAFGADLIADLPELRLIVTTGRANAAIDVTAAHARGVRVAGTDSRSEPVVEMTFALILALSRNVVLESVRLRAGRWQSTVGTDLNGATLGVLGLGRIGTGVARVANAFGMTTLAWSSQLTPEGAQKAGATYTPLGQLLAASDIVTIHMRLSGRTEGLLGARELGAMRDRSILINTSRSAIVDRGALIAALDSGRPAVAGLDVFDVEPSAVDDALINHPRVLATPHLGYVTRANYSTFYSQAVEDIRAYSVGEDLRSLT